VCLLLCYPLPLSYSVLQACATGLAFVHSRGIVHRDIKSLNYLIDSSLQVKLGDLGVSQDVKGVARESEEGTPCTLNWAAPEVLLSLPNSMSSDVFSLGVVIWEIMSDRMPWVHLRRDFFVYRRVVVHEGRRLRLPSVVPAPVARLCECMWATDPSARPSTDAVVAALDHFATQVSVSVSVSGKAGRQAVACVYICCQIHSPSLACTPSLPLSPW
jgi:serine/threonine protein kinase